MPVGISTLRKEGLGSLISWDSCFAQLWIRLFVTSCHIARVGVHSFFFFYFWKRMLVFIQDQTETRSSSFWCNLRLSATRTWFQARTGNIEGRLPHRASVSEPQSFLLLQGTSKPSGRRNERYPLHRFSRCNPAVPTLTCGPCWDGPWFGVATRDENDGNRRENFSTISVPVFYYGKRERNSRECERKWNLWVMKTGRN